VGLFRALDGTGEEATMRDAALRIGGVVDARGDHAAVDVAELVGTRVLKHVRGPSQERAPPM
jgi:hypothetical protein